MLTRRTLSLGLLSLSLSSRALADDLPPIHAAAAYGHTDELTRLIAGNLALIHSTDTEGNTPLHHAAWNNQLEAARILLQAGAQVDVRRGGTSIGVTALESASYHGHQEMVELLITSKANVNVAVYEGYTPLHQAARNGHVAVCRYLIEHGARLTDTRTNGRAPLHTAAENGQTETVLLLLALGANPSARDRAGETPSGVAANDTVRQVLLRALITRADADARRAERALTQPLSTSAKKVTIVYESTFSSGEVGLEWSTSALGGQWNDLAIHRTPKTDTPFLGAFGNQEIRLAIGHLPPHNALRIAFDLWIIGSWDGNGTPQNGPDLFTLSLLGGPTLLRTTFFNPGRGMAGAALQSFPDDYTLGNHLGGTGALSQNSLDLWKDSETDSYRDSIYRLGYTFSHRDETAVFRLSAQGLEGLDNESWGLGRLRVAALTLGSTKP